MELVVPAPLACGGCVGDVLVLGYPLHPVAHFLHTGVKFGLCTALRERRVDGVHQLEFEAPTPHSRAVFSSVHGLHGWLLIGLQNLQAMCLTDFIGEGAQLLQVLFIELELQPGFTADGIDNQVVVPVITVDMGGNLDFVALKPPGKLNSHLVDFLRCGSAVRFEALHILVEKHLTFFSVLLFCCHKFLKGGFSAAVLPRQKPALLAVFVLEKGLIILRHIIHYLFHGGTALRFFLDGGDDCHRLTPLCPSGRRWNRTPPRSSVLCR